MCPAAWLHHILSHYVLAPSVSGSRSRLPIIFSHPLPPLCFFATHLTDSKHFSPQASLDYPFYLKKIFSFFSFRPFFFFSFLFSPCFLHYIAQPLLSRCHQFQKEIINQGSFRQPTSPSSTTTLSETAKVEQEFKRGRNTAAAPTPPGKNYTTASTSLLPSSSHYDTKWQRDTPVF